MVMADGIPRIFLLFFFLTVTNTSLKEVWFSKRDNFKATSCFLMKRCLFSECVASCLEHNRGCEVISYNENSSVCELCDANSKLALFQGWQSWISESAEEITKPIADCSEWYNLGARESGVYNIYTSYGHQALVYCDMETGGGGWTIFQKRLDGTQDFFLPWSYYKHGFGSPDHEYWLGNDVLHDMTNGSTVYELRIDLEDFENTTVFVLYDEFRVAGESEKYRLTVNGYNEENSTVGDSLIARHNRKNFTTIDQVNVDTTRNCSQEYKGGWWYGDPCHFANLNGLYLKGNSSFGEGVIWRDFKGLYYSIKRSEMKIRPVGFNGIS